MEENFFEQPDESLQHARLSQEDINAFMKYVGAVKSEVRKVIIGQRKLMDLFIAALFVKGHILIEGVPGIAKTLAAKLLAKTVKSDFSRIQFTPDLMPSDIIGTNVFNLKSSEFEFRKGPVFSNIVLIDEINRAPAKTQAALFEVMEERQISVDGQTFAMDFPFMVIATQNPIEQEGTYKLPEAQLDRFIFKINVSYPNLEEEKAILKRFSEDFEQKINKEVKPVIDGKVLKKCQDLVEKVYIKDELIDYTATIVYNTRNNSDLFLGASPRASLAIMKASKAIALMQGRDYVTPDDIKFVSYPVLNHRVILSADSELEGVETKDVINEIISKVEVPR